ncbi:hypothetical protein GCM10027612_51340 [Microbispora bryophytorum subsp. camponoti]
MNLHHRFDGPPDAPVVVLGPSLGTTLDLWEPQLPALTRTWRVLRYDLPGHGGSPAASGLTDDELTDDGLTVDDLAAGVLALLDRHGLDTVAYGGVSLGGAVGTTLALRAPDRVASLVLCCTTARFGTAESWHERAALVRAEGTKPLAEATRRRWFTAGFPTPSASWTCSATPTPKDTPRAATPWRSSTSASCSARSARPPW